MDKNTGLLSMAAQQQDIGTSQGADDANAGNVGNDAQSIAADASGGMSNEQIALLKKAKKAADNMIFDDQIFGEIIKQADKGDRTETLATITVMVLGKAEEVVGELPVSLILALGISIIVEVADLIGQTGREPYTAEEVESALALATQMWLQNNQGRVSESDIQGAVDSTSKFMGA